MAVFENFISYRRKETMLEVKNIYDALRNRGYSTFCDVYTLDNGNFDEKLIQYVRTCTNYILVLGAHSLDRCREPNDWLLREIKTALESRRNVVIVFVGAVDLTSLPKEIKELQHKNGLTFDVLYFDSFIDQLTQRFLVRGTDWAVATETDFTIEGTTLVRYTGKALRVVIPEGVTEIGRAVFKDDTRVQEIVLPRSLEAIGDSAFERCLSLKHVELSEGVLHLGKRAFARCYDLLNVNANDRLETIGEECFAFCTSLKIFSIPPAVTVCHATAFNGCNLLAQFIVEEGNHTFTVENGILYTDSGSVLFRCPLHHPDTYLVLPDTVRTIGAHAFSDCTAISDVILPPVLTTIEAYAFEECRNLNRLDLPRSIRAVAETAFSGWEADQTVTVEEPCDPQIREAIEGILRRSVGDTVEAVDCEYVLVKTTFESDKEAADMARGLLKRRLIVSGQISQLRSIYTWEDKVCDENEYELSCITRGARYPEIEAYIHAYHSFELCELMVVPILHVPDNFGAWVSSYVKEEPPC